MILDAAMGILFVLAYIGFFVCMIAPFVGSNPEE